MNSSQENHFFERMSALLDPDQARELIATLHNFPAKTVRFNRLQNSRVEPEGTEIPWCRPYGRVWQRQEAPSATLEYLAGGYYIQEKSAMLAVALAEVNLDFTGKKVLDLCAAPGGKTTQAAELATDGLVVANEVIKSRVDALIWNVVRHRVTNTVVVSEESGTLAENLPGFFDIIIVDAPCSGEGLFMKKKNSLEEWSEKNVLFCAARQSGILQNAARMLKTGGYLVYSTCTFAREENEDQVEKLLTEGFSAVELHAVEGVSAAVSDNPEVLKCARRLFPHREGGAGAFAAILQKTGEEEVDSSPLFYGEAAVQEKHPLLPDLLPAKSCYYTKNGIISRLDYPSLPEFIFRRARQTGQPILNIQKYCDPMQGMITMAGQAALLEISEEQGRRFARGEDLRLDMANGWYFVVSGQLLLGVAKVAAGRAVNKLPNPLLVKNQG